MTQTRKTSKTHPDHTKITEEERMHVAMLVEMNLYSRTAIADAFGVTRKTVNNCHWRYFG